MMMRRVIVISITGAASVFLNARVADAQVTTATIVVKGMACPFCACGVEKKLKEVEGVQGVSVDTKSGTAVVSCRADETIALQKLPQAIKASGFTPGGMRAEALGILEKDEGGRFFLISSGGERLFVLHHLDRKLKNRLEDLKERKMNVRIAGSVHTNENAISTMVPENVEPLRQK
jgi:mercuric ion binding protein|tara:strand:- start:687 stop:1214 length:528 start_codon:yes stop_codon:yes gene_type:complete